MISPLQAHGAEQYGLGTRYGVQGAEKLTVVNAQRARCWGICLSEAKPL